MSASMLAVFKTKGAHPYSLSQTEIGLVGKFSHTCCSCHVNTVRIRDLPVKCWTQGSYLGRGDNSRASRRIYKLPSFPLSPCHLVPKSIPDKRTSKAEPYWLPCYLLYRVFPTGKSAHVSRVTPNCPNLLVSKQWCYIPDQW